MLGKVPMQADGDGTRMAMPDENGELASRRSSMGESDGGPYPNPHTGKNGSKRGPDRFNGHGGQTEQAYYGGQQLGDKVVGDQPNAPSREVSE
jgi:hypothetical protein